MELKNSLNLNKKRKNISLNCYSKNRSIWNCPDGVSCQNNLIEWKICVCTTLYNNTQLEVPTQREQEMIHLCPKLLVMYCQIPHLCSCHTVPMHLPIERAPLPGRCTNTYTALTCSSPPSWEMQWGPWSICPLSPRTVSLRTKLSQVSVVMPPVWGNLRICFSGTFLLCSSLFFSHHMSEELLFLGEHAPVVSS